MKSDRELYEEFLNGSKEDFEQIVIRYKDRLIYFIQRYVKNYDVAEDLMQDVFVYVLINRKEYDFKYSLKTYLYTIAKSRAINYLKRQKKIVFLKDDDVLVEENDSVEEIIFRKEKEENIIKAIKKLKPEWQSIIYLSKIEEMKYKDICKILGKSLPQVKSSIHRANKQLEKILREEAKIYEE